jgi:hypothetical protein
MRKPENQLQFPEKFLLFPFILYTLQHHRHTFSLLSGQTKFIKHRIAHPEFSSNPFS